MARVITIGLDTKQLVAGKLERITTVRIMATAGVITGLTLVVHASGCDDLIALSNR